MRPAVIIGAGAAAGLGLWFFMRRPDMVQAVEWAEDEPAQDATPDPFADYELPNVFNQVQDMIRPTDEDQAGANVAAFLMTIRKAEGTAGPNGYRTLFGGSLFTGWADHPRTVKKYRDLWTSAAGAYQFLAISPIPGGKFTKINTWDRIAERLGLADFSPESQDLAAIELIREAGALGDVRAGRFDQAVNKVRGIWASLPGAGYNQPERSLESLRVAYLNAGGNLA